MIFLKFVVFFADSCSFGFKSYGNLTNKGCEAEILVCNLVFGRPHQSYGMDHLFTFTNLRQLGLLGEQQPGETLTVMESKMGKLVNDKTAGDEAELLMDY